MVATQLDQHITSNNLDEPMQSAFKKHHSTETALIKVQNDILQAIDNQNSVILLLLDISAAFDTIDHEILLSRLSSRYGITGKAHKWFESYLNERTFTVHVSGGRAGLTFRGARGILLERGPLTPPPQPPNGILDPKFSKI